MRNEFIPYKEALALKELGFDEPCFYMWNIDTKELFSSNSTDINEQPTNLDLIGNVDFTAPLYQQAFRWFREKYDLVSEIQAPDGKGGKWNPTIHKVCGFGNHYDNDGFKTYEEAQDACLRKLIEVVNQILNQNKDE